MIPLPHHDFHAHLGARLEALNGHELVADYGDAAAEYLALRNRVGVLDFSFRGRLCALGDDRAKFLHGQVTNDVNRLQSGQGCYSAITDNKGRIQSDLNLHALAEEILIDFEPGLTAALRERLERFLVADDVEFCDVADAFGLISVQGPKACETVERLALFPEPPRERHAIIAVEDATLGSLYLANHARLNTAGFDLYAPAESIPAIFDKLSAAAEAEQGARVGWAAFETARIEAGIPRFGQDMTEANLAPEAGIAERAISYQKGCYIGQEILNRLHNFAQVSKTLLPLRFAGERLPSPGAELTADGKKAGAVTSAATLPDSGRHVGLGYVRKEFADGATTLAGDGFTATIEVS